MKIIKQERILETLVNDGMHTYLRRSVDEQRVTWRIQAGIDVHGDRMFVELLDKEKELQLERELEMWLSEKN